MGLGGYQTGMRWEGVRMNISLISSYLAENAETALDIGCNEGLVTCAMAMSGTKATGMEMQDKYLSMARKVANRLNTSTRFENKKLSLEDLKSIAPYDVVSFLSVHHQIASADGLKNADIFLRSLAAKAEKQFFFQPACISAKYGNHGPDISDNDISAYEDYFCSILKNDFEYYALIGFAQNDIPKSEPMRPLMLFSRVPIQLNKTVNFSHNLEKIEIATSNKYRLANIFRH